MLTALAFCATFSDAFHYSPLIFGIFQAMVFGSLIIGTHCVKIGLQKFSVNKLITVAICISLLGATLSLIFSLALQEALFYFIIALMIFTFGNAFSFAPLQRLAIEASTAPMGARMAILSTMMSGSGTIGSLLAGYFYFGTTLSLACITVISAIVALLCIRYSGIYVKSS
jgi:hypothetical protein